MKPPDKSANLPELETGGPSGGLLFWGMRILFVVSLAIVGLAGPALLIVAGIAGGPFVLVILGTLVLGLVLGLGTMVFAGQRKLHRMMQRLAEETGLSLSETPDLVPGLSHLSLAGELRGRWVTLSFENLPGPVTTEYRVELGKWQISRKRRHLIASIRIETGQGGESGEWIDTSVSDPGGIGKNGLSSEKVAWLRERSCHKVFLGGGRAAMAWDAKMTDEGLALAIEGISFLAEFAERLDSGSKTSGVSSLACPICGATMILNPRYPRAVCASCVRRTCDAEGRFLDFFNADFGGGFLAVYREGGEKYDCHDCFIDGHSCRADEARFGGIVVQVSEVT